MQVIINGVQNITVFLACNVYGGGWGMDGHTSERTCVQRALSMSLYKHQERFDRHTMKQSDKAGSDIIFPHNYF